MKKNYITREDLLIFCTACQFLKTKKCPHPKFRDYFKKKKIDGVGCVGGKSVKEKLQEERKERHETTRISNN